MLPGGGGLGGVNEDGGCLVGGGFLVRGVGDRGLGGVGERGFLGRRLGGGNLGSGILGLGGSLSRSFSVRARGGHRSGGAVHGLVDGARTAVEALDEDAADLGENLIDRTHRVDDNDALGLGVGQAQVFVAHTLVKVHGLAFHTVRGVGAAARANLRRQVQEERQGRVEALGRPRAQGGDFVDAEGAGRALVGQRGVDVAVPQHDRSTLEGGADDRGDVVGAVGRVQEGLRARIHVLGAVLHKTADLRSQLGAARLAGDDDLTATALEPVAHGLDLRGLPGAVATFEGDEHSSRRHQLSFFVAALVVAVFFAVVFFAVVFLAAVVFFAAVVFLVVVFFAAILRVRLGAGPLARLSARSS